MTQKEDKSDYFKQSEINNELKSKSLIQKQKKTGANDKIHAKNTLHAYLKKLTWRYFCVGIDSGAWNFQAGKRVVLKLMTRILEEENLQKF